MAIPEDIFLEEVALAAKTLRSVRAGYSLLQTMSESGRWRTADPSIDDPRYVCAMFGDGGHIPVPLLLPVGEEEPAPGLQGRVLRALQEEGSLEDVLQEIRRYDLQYFGRLPEYYDPCGIIDQHLRDMGVA